MYNISKSVKKIKTLMKKIIGIDPGLANIGWGIIESYGSRLNYIDSGYINTKADTPFEIRLKDIFNKIDLIIKEHKPEYFCIESIYFVEGKNNKSAMTVAQARGVMCLIASLNNLVFYEYTPLEVKKSVVGSAGYAQKDQIKLMVNLILNINKTFTYDHESDALALAICGFHNMNR